MQRNLIRLPVPESNFSVSKLTMAGSNDTTVGDLNEQANDTQTPPALESELRECLKRYDERLHDQNERDVRLMSELSSIKRTLQTQPHLTEEGKKARIAPGVTFKESGCQKNYSRQLPLIEELEKIDVHTNLMMAVGNPSQELLLQYSEIVNSGEHRSDVFFTSLLVSQAGGWHCLAGFVGSNRAAQMLPRHQRMVMRLALALCLLCRKAVRGTSRIYLAPCWPICSL